MTHIYEGLLCTVEQEYRSFTEPKALIRYTTAGQWHSGVYLRDVQPLAEHKPGGENCGDTTFYGGGGTDNCAVLIDGEDGFVGASCPCECHETAL